MHENPLPPHRDEDLAPSIDGLALPLQRLQDLRDITVNRLEPARLVTNRSAAVDGARLRSKEKRRKDRKEGDTQNRFQAAV